jgi:dolichol kinase
MSSAIMAILSFFSMKAFILFILVLMRSLTSGLYSVGTSLRAPLSTRKSIISLYDLASSLSSVSSNDSDSRKVWYSWLISLLYFKPTLSNSLEVNAIGIVCLSLWDSIMKYLCR